MWPSRHGLGVQLGYGLQGSNFHSGSLDQERPWKFARQRDGGLALSEVRFSKETLVPPQISDSEISDSKDNTFKSALKDVPSDIMGQILKNEEFLSSKYVYDPTYSEMIDYQILQNNKKSEIHTHSEVIAYVSDPTGCTLNVHIIQRTKNFIMSKEHSFDLFIPTLGKGCSWEFDSPIKQIKIRQDSSPTDYPQVLIIRTANSIYLLQLRSKITHKVECNLKLIGTIHPSDLYDENFAYVNTSPFDKTLFLIVDVKGNWGLGKIRKIKVPRFLTKGRIFDPDEVSSFKRIIWSNHPDIMYVIGRTYIKQFNLETLEKKDIVLAGKWSEIRDYKNFTYNLNFGILLTSKELIWIDIANGFKRVLSWKHYLESDDPSLSLTVRTIGDITFALIHSQVHPIVLIHQFKIEDGFPTSVRDPTMVNLGSKAPAYGYTMIPAFFNDIIGSAHDEKFLALTIFKVSTQLDVSRIVVSTLNNSLLLKYPSSRELSIKGQAEAQLADDKASMINRNIEKLQTLTDELFYQISEDTTEDQDDAAVFQDFATKLNVQDKDTRSPFTLINHAESIQNFQGFEEFDNLMEQFQDHCRQINLELLPLSKLNQLLLKNNTESISDLFKKLLKLWNHNNPDEEDKLYTKYISRDLALSSSVIYNPQEEESKSPELINGLPRKLRDIVDKWDEGFEEQEEEQIPSQFLETPEPVIKPIVTVSHSQPINPSQGLLRPSQRTQSLIAKPQFPSSQQQSQPASSVPAAASQPVKTKKKKRRIKGFG
ncbi:RNA polymerase I-specific transcription initiation factor RRN6 [Wickerhamomyces ciferrii]|uniref:RNA polymerase I-specific transcription initiation factor RRN6 n=1 Tax=Wickerhamomyces ciferrii (strain ATCC 14091 / BCRC 22168 / CBS 111 / JCM 3599 / NBRC 0793 / NRRL Y-1031 F-60-10) TaxID=1206466 RepID=K0KH63_WICCF|nr:RNA polymerase I-specific transcription initiation factor RRN6 [Wickerhamomyces ciferrii]CCH44555.1 RNA polymerase I-specific transcription initiation factor RRN6 [Wickerhamomyces ciferrii]